MRPLRFEFDPEKLIQAIVFFSKRGARDLTRLKLAKLLFFADREHLLMHGRPVFGDEYFALSLGPVPSRSIDFLEEMEQGIALPDRERFDRYLSIEAAQWPCFVARGPEDFDVFSESELRVLESILTGHALRTASQLVELSHEDVAWKLADASRPPYGRAAMPYETWLETGGRPDMLELAQAEQDTRDFAASLRR